MPTDIYKTLPELNILFQEMIIAMLGYTKTGSPAAYAEAAYKAVRVAWPTEGAPAWKITDDVACIRVVEDDHAINREREDEYENIDDGLTLNEATSYTRVLNLFIAFYGPSSFEHAQEVRDCLFKNVYRQYLAEYSIYLVPDIVAPRRAPEPFQGQWWERTDLELRFNEKVVKNDEINSIGSAEVAVYDRNGLVAEIEITET